VSDDARCISCFPKRGKDILIKDAAIPVFHFLKRNTMKIVMLLTCLAAAAAYPARDNVVTYIVKDSLGRPIIETSNTMLVYSMRNVVVDSVQRDKITVCPIKNKAVIDSLKSSIEAKIGKPTKGEFYYRVEWLTRDSLEIVIVKPASPRAILYCNRKGLNWLKQNEPGIIDTLK
jgi:hypothetical protein